MASVDVRNVVKVYRRDAEEVRVLQEHGVRMWISCYWRSACGHEPDISAASKCCHW